MSPMSGDVTTGHTEEGEMGQIGVWSFRKLGHWPQKDWEMVVTSRHFSEE